MREPLCLANSLGVVSPKDSPRLMRDDFRERSKSDRRLTGCSGWRRASERWMLWETHRLRGRRGGRATARRGAEGNVSFREGRW